MNIRIKIIPDRRIRTMPRFFSFGHDQICTIDPIRHKMILQNVHLYSVDNVPVSEIPDHTVHGCSFPAL